jgi:hypothetical protein
MKIVIIKLWIVDVPHVNYHFLDLIPSNKFHPFDMILKHKYIIILKHFKKNCIPASQHTPLAAHRPFGTAEQLGVLIAHGIRLRFSVEH